jgi:hypothetical protein
MFSRLFQDPLKVSSLGRKSFKNDCTESKCFESLRRELKQFISLFSLHLMVIRPLNLTKEEYGPF